LNPNFIDHVRITCRSGNGGAGSAHLRREKFVAKGGPDGGDGGRGGHIVLRGNRNLWTLLHLRYTRHVFAKHGMAGGKQTSTGASGQDSILEVPLGTIALDADTKEQLLEITEHGQTLILLEGGRGGLGNSRFKSSTNQTPRYAQPGEEGVEKNVVFELKLLADVGLVGFPNAGKSTLLSVVSAAKPEIADYPFTTLKPNLGVVSYRDSTSFVMADIPGIIEGAHLGKGLGYRFLRHIERNSVLLFMIPADSKSIKKEFETLLNELKQYNPELLDKNRLLAVTKCDLLTPKKLLALENKLPEVDSVIISSHTNSGIVELKDMIWKALNPVTEL